MDRQPVGQVCWHTRLSKVQVWLIHHPESAASLHHPTVCTRRPRSAVASITWTTTRALEQRAGSPKEGQGRLSGSRLRITLLNRQTPPTGFFLSAPESTPR